MLRSHVILAVFKRNVASYFSGVLGYLFIVVFVVAGAFFAFSPQFFTNNEANLDQLSQMYPLLLLFLMPAITMTTWADEKKLGTAELLFTLPAADVEILLGKYLAVLAVYSIVLSFSLTHLFVLAWIGDPDWGLIFTTYVGYFLSGAALLSAGMFASVLTSSATVAFVLGVALCAIPVFIGALVPWNDFVQSLSLNEQLRDFSMGILSLSGILYFASLTAFMLYLNLVSISRRHWSAGRQTYMGLHFAVRTLSLAVMLGGLNFVAAHGAVRGDLTAENLYSLSKTTRQLIGNIDKERPVKIYAYISPEVPREYVPVRKRLIGLLRQYDQLGGGGLDVRYVDVEPFSQESDEAKHYGIEPVRIRTEREGRHVEEDLFLGVVITSTYDQVIIPFFGAGTPIEYELTRSIRTVSNETRLTVGILRTDAQVLAGSGGWRIVTELKQQYDVEDVSPDSAIEADKYDVLIAVMPSSLTQPQMRNFVDYVKAGHAVLIFDDPFPVIFSTRSGVTNAPRQSKPQSGGQMGMFGGRPPQPTPKADGGKATSLLRVLNIKWVYDQIVWAEYNPHPEFYENIPDGYLFISPKSGTKSAFNSKSEITSGLQEILAAFSGTLQPRVGNDDVDFEPLLRTGRFSGLLDWKEFTVESVQFQGGQIQMAARLAPPVRPRIEDEIAHVIAAHITSDKNNQEINAVYVADVDLISDWFFYERSRGESNLKLDNVTFVLNAVDVLAGDNSYLELRKRRSEHRTLRKVEQQTSQFFKKRNEEQKKADDEAKEYLEAARRRFQKRRENLENDKTMDQREKGLRLRELKTAEERRIVVATANIERDKKKKIEEIKASTQRQIRETENRIRYTAVTIPPIPAILLGIVILSMRLYQERQEITPDRLVKR